MWNGLIISEMTELDFVYKVVLVIWIIKDSIEFGYHEHHKDLEQLHYTRFHKCTSVWPCRLTSWLPFTSLSRPLQLTTKAVGAQQLSTEATPAVCGNCFIRWWSMRPSKATLLWHWEGPALWQKAWSTTSTTFFRVAIVPITSGRK